MSISKQLKKLLSHSYEVEAELSDLIEQCFKEIFKEQASYAISLFEEDLEGGKEFNGCLQGLEYYKAQVKQSQKTTKELQQVKELYEAENAKSKTD